jgi:hypothetical protein
VKYDRAWSKLNAFSVSCGFAHARLAHMREVSRCG